MFAVWAVRKAALAEMRAGVELGEIFRRSRDHGLMPENVDATGREWSPRMGLSEGEITSYLRENIHYTLDAKCRKGLALYFRLAAECGVIEQAPELEFLEESDGAGSRESLRWTMNRSWYLGHLYAL